MPQRQFPRAIRPAHRSWVIVAPGGAVKAWPERLNPPYVPAVSRSLTPRVSPPFVGHDAYVSPAFAKPAHAALLCPNAAAESHDTTVYCPAAASEQSAISTAA